MYYMVHKNAKGTECYKMISPSLSPLGTSLSQFSTIITVNGEIQVTVHTYILIPCFLSLPLNLCCYYF